MYAFSRTALLGAGDVREQLTWALAITEKVNQISEVPFRLWSSVFSAGVGTLTWATTVESLAELEAIDDKLSVDDGFLGLLAEGAKHASGQPVNDSVLQLLHTDPNVDIGRIQYINYTSACAAPGHMSRAAEVGIEIARRSSTLGSPTTFGVALTGTPGTYAWIGFCESVEQLQHGQETVNADPEFAAYVDEHASQVFLAGTANTRIARKIL